MGSAESKPHVCTSSCRTDVGCPNNKATKQATDLVDRLNPRSILEDPIRGPLYLNLIAALQCKNGGRTGTHSGDGDAQAWAKTVTEAIVAFVSDQTPPPPESTFSFNGEDMREVVMTVYTQYIESL